jgi:hypothetical protein
MYIFLFNSYIHIFIGEWIGIILDEPKGKNNGTVQKKGNLVFILYLILVLILDGTIVRYFSCNDNCGLYVRPGQIESVINDSQTNLSRSASNQSVKSQGSSTGSIPPPTTSIVPPKSSGLPTKQTGLRPPRGTTPTRTGGIIYLHKKITFS